MNSPWGDVRGIRARVTFSPQGFRDVMWCPYLNEPAILEWRGAAAWCTCCQSEVDAKTHLFLCHIEKKDAGAAD